MSWYLDPAAPLSDIHLQHAQARQQQLTKPQGSLGQLEQLAITLAQLQHREQPICEHIVISVFAGDHGVAAEGVSAFPQSVTAQMVQNFASGGAAISVLARALNASLEVVNTGTVDPLPTLDHVLDCRIAAGTANFAQQSAMTPEQLQKALSLGHDSITRAKQADAHLWIGGEMGITNTTSATALACALLKKHAAELVGPGTGLDNAGQIHKSAVIHRSLDLFNANAQTPLKNLQYLGGFEIAALSGAYIAAAQQGIPAMVDGFICSVAALYAQAINPSIKPWLLYSHRSAEPGHRAVLEALEAEPLLDLGMRLGEGSGAATAVPLVQMACKLHNHMATFAEAMVDNCDDA